MRTKGTTYLGIDGGGTRCRARIEDENGRVLGEAGSGPATTRIGLDKAWRSIMEATEAAAAQAGLTHEDFARTHAGIGLAGLGRRGAKAALDNIAHPFASVMFISDGLAACLGAHSGADGAIVVAGTGSIGVGLIGGRELRFGGYGFYVVKGKPTFTWNLLDLKRVKWQSPEALTPGKHTLEFDFKYEGLGFATLAFNNVSGVGRSGSGRFHR